MQREEVRINVHNHRHGYFQENVGQVPAEIRQNRRRWNDSDILADRMAANPEEIRQITLHLRENGLIRIAAWINVNNTILRGDPRHKGL